MAVPWFSNRLADILHFYSFFFFFFFYKCIVPMGFLPWEIEVALPGKSQLWQSCATQPTVHGGCFSVSIMHWILTWTTWSLTWVQMLMHATAGGGGGMNTIRESALKVDSGRKIPCCTGESNLHQWRADLMRYQLSYVPAPAGKCLAWLASASSASLEWWWQCLAWLVCNHLTSQSYY